MSSVLSVAEHREGELRDVSAELVAAGSELAEFTGGKLALAIIGGDSDAFAETLNLNGVSTIYTIDRDEEYNHDVYVESLEELVESIDPNHVLMPHTVNGWDYAPAFANRVDRALITDVFGFELDGSLKVIREMYGSKVETPFRVNADRTAITIRPGEWDAVEAPGSADVQAFDVEIDDSALGTEVSGYEAAEEGDVDISEAEFIVSVGRGIEEEENMEIMEELADAAGATLAASRPITDNGWLPKNRQVGQSGKDVEPKIYIAFGISGAVQHVAGMKSSETIVAVNTDPDAPIYDIADYGAVSDLFDVVPNLTEEFKNT